MTMFLVADADGSLWLFSNYPHRFQDVWVNENDRDHVINIDEDFLTYFGIEPPSFQSDPIIVSFTLIALNQ